MYTIIHIILIYFRSISRVEATKMAFHGGHSRPCWWDGGRYHRRDAVREELYSETLSFKSSPGSLIRGKWTRTRSSAEI